jgi:hypothetical protein
MTTPAPPPLWQTLAQLWHLDDQEAWRCWRALYRAKWSLAASFRQRLVHFEGQPAYQRLTGVDALVREHLTPADVLAVLEALTAEGLLSGRDRIQIEEKVLRCVNAAGTWTYPQLPEGASHG